MNVKIRNVIAGSLIIGGVLLIFGAIGYSDMYERTGDFIPFTNTIKKILVGVILIPIGVLIRKGKH